MTRKKDCFGLHFINILNAQSFIQLHWIAIALLRLEWQSLLVNIILVIQLWSSVLYAYTKSHREIVILSFVVFIFSWMAEYNIEIIVNYFLLFDDAFLFIVHVLLQFEFSFYFRKVFIASTYDISFIRFPLIHAINGRSKYILNGSMKYRLWSF